MKNFVWITSAIVAASISLPALAQVSQAEHDRIEQRQIQSDHQHHTGAKIIGGSAVGDAVVGGVLGGGKGALIGGAIGAGGGALANHERKEHDVRKTEASHTAYHSRYRRHRHHQ